MLTVQDHLSLISSQYFATGLQPNKPSYSVVKNPSISVSISCCSVSIYRIYLYEGTWPPSSKSLQTKAVSNSKTLQTHSRILQTASPQVAVEETKISTLQNYPFPTPIILL